MQGQGDVASIQADPKLSPSRPGRAQRLRSRIRSVLRKRSTTSLSASGPSQANRAAAPPPTSPRAGQGDVTRFMGGTFPTEIPHGWTKYVHLNGGVYFYHRALRLITPDDMEDAVQREAVMALYAEDMDVLEDGGLLPYIPEESDILIRYAYDDGRCCSFFLCHNERKHIAFPSEGPDLEVQENTVDYWSHIEEHPMHLDSIPPHAEEYFLSAMSYGANEGIYNRDSTFPYTDAQIAVLVEIYSLLKGALKTNPDVLPTFNWYIARTLYHIESARLHTRGSNDVGFNLRRKPITGRTSFTMDTIEFLLMFVLFGAHKMYRARLQKVRTGKSAHLVGFRQLLGEFLAEWSDSNLLSTVFVGANIAFQQVPNINSLQERASLISTFFAILSVISGVHHVWQHRTHLNADIVNAVKYMNHAREWEHSDDSPERAYDLIVMSCFLAVPITSLLWSLLTFTIALCAFCVQNTSTEGSRFMSAILAALAFAGVVAVVVWQVWSRLGRQDATTSPPSEPSAKRTLAACNGGVLRGLRMWLRRNFVRERVRQDDKSVV